MYEKYDFEQGDENRIVYVRKVALKDLPDDVREQAQAGGLKSLYAVHSADGEQLALVRDRALAFVLARQNDFAPVTVH
ncbi:DUF1150 family protein [Aquicoccus sp. G2-2]|jgi:hypothetical protein|uniref:DUF1150 family protein n=1 Tax=Aquicoccus sp. G2-2 TaxID=3092120 RepID=UPI002ADF48D3|nr:DUF1150 family protein [Aquicoccus sp. G2-2]MEA1113754.1 DUF1150 family protein [Aquicoccus sp. G2-2]